MKKIDDLTLANVSSFSAFLIPATSLCLKSGYAYGVLLFLLSSLFSFRRWCRYPQSKQTVIIALLFIGMAILWYELSYFENKEWDRASKYLAGAVCLLYAMAFPPKREAFYWGLAVGCAGGGVLGIWQVYVLGMYRANGFTNAIQWGNIALLMATMLGIQLCIFWQRQSWLHRAIVIICILLGLEASVLSAARGGWLALLVVIPVMALFIFRYRRDIFLKFSALLVVAGFAVAITNFDMLAKRWQKAEAEIGHYFGGQQVDTSLGIRLEQYRSAIEMIKEKPLLGWGSEGYLHEMRKRVDEGRYDRSIHEYNFVHHEFLDLWVKNGVIGVAIQMFAYVYVFYIFWPSRRRMHPFEGNVDLWRTQLSLRLCGVTLVLMYFLFNQSVQFFVQNNGIIFFVFPILIVWSALHDYQSKRLAHN
ncbi:MAG: O-antigen ligase family protein [Oxalicibacterium faecigallinarum]|uniref:O-antigen ligase family protein n=1 Tax=Oxalicibacterium faecigallinarum TaxID=573741 RepID=UPI0028093197|nr:O-antigen ligase family protein [Oxalicibacterium faecigallinarum]MDQ7969988.1 O-antigen ligase family protein [Oxalicibacterium faecigallinarum]